MRRNYQDGDPRLSLCMIIKNEAETLERALESVREWVDEIVVLDTGSTDGSQEIAKRYADVFDEVEWPDSFSQARNMSFDRATGDFVMYLDGDESVTSAEGWEQVWQALRTPETICVLMLINNVLAENSLMQADRMHQDRVFLNHPEIRFVGDVHNQIGKSVLAHRRRHGGRIVQTEAEILHTGYAHGWERMRDKYTARLHLLRREYEHPRSERLRAYYGYQLALVLKILGRWEESAEVFESIDYACMIPSNRLYAHILAAQVGIKLNKPAMTLVHGNRALGIARHEPIAHFVTSLGLLMSGRVGDGLLLLTEAFRLTTSPPPGVRFPLNPRPVVDMLVRVLGAARLEGVSGRLAELAAADELDVEAVGTLLQKLSVRLALASDAA